MSMQQCLAHENEKSGTNSIQDSFSHAVFQFPGYPCTRIIIIIVLRKMIIPFSFHLAFHLK